MCKTIFEWRTARKMTQTEAASMVGIGQAAWAKWEKGQVPAEQCLKVHKITGIALHLLRSDIYPVPQRRKREGAQA